MKMTVYVNGGSAHGWTDMWVKPPFKSFCGRNPFSSFQLTSAMLHKYHRMISWRQPDVRPSGYFSFLPLGSKVRRVVGSPGHKDFPNLGVPNQIALFEMVFTFLRWLLTPPRVLLLRNYFHDKWQSSRDLFCKELFQNSNKSNNHRWLITFLFDFLFRLRFLECC